MTRSFLRTAAAVATRLDAAVDPPASISAQDDSQFVRVIFAVLRARFGQFIHTEAQPGEVWTDKKRHNLVMGTGGKTVEILVTARRDVHGDQVLFVDPEDINLGDGTIDKVAMDHAIATLCRKLGNK